MKKHYYFSELDYNAQEYVVDTHKNWVLDEHWYQDTIDLFGDLGAYVEDFQVEINPTYLHFTFEIDPSEVAENFLQEFPECIHCANWLKFDQTSPSEDDYDLALYLFKNDMEEFMLDIIKKEYNALTEWGRMVDFLNDSDLLFDSEGRRVSYE